MKKIVNLMAIITSFTLLFHVGLTGAQEGRICPNVDEPPALTKRVVRINQLGVEVTIPANFRVVLRRNGIVEIMNPSTFSEWECQAKGGVVYGHGYYAQTLQILPRDFSMSFREQAIWSVGFSKTEEGLKKSVASQIHSYTWHQLPSYIVESQSKYGTVMMVLLPGNKRVLQMSVTCDCEVNMEDMLRLVESVELIP